MFGLSMIPTCAGLVAGGSRQLCKGGPCEARGEGRRCLAIRLGFHGRGHRGSRGDDCERFPHCKFPLVTPGLALPLSYVFSRYHACTVICRRHCAPQN